MTFVKQLLSEKEKVKIENLINSIPDYFSDFYITKDNTRLFIRENQDLFFECLKRGDKIAWNEKGIAFITGWSDKSSRKYIKILSEDEQSAEQLIKVTFWHVDCSLFAKVKKDSPLRRVLERNQFRFAGDRGSQILLKHTYIPRPTPKNYKEEDEE